jgi:hypothetical protein
VLGGYVVVVIEDGKVEEWGGRSHGAGMQRRLWDVEDVRWKIGVVLV